MYEKSLAPQVRSSVLFKPNKCFIHCGSIKGCGSLQSAYGQGMISIELSLAGSPFFFVQQLDDFIFRNLCDPL